MEVKQGLKSGPHNQDAGEELHIKGKCAQVSPVSLHLPVKAVGSTAHFQWSCGSHECQRAWSTCPPINLSLRLSELTPSHSICCCGSGCSTFMQIKTPDPQAIRNQGIFSMPGKWDSSGIQQNCKASAHKWVQFWPNTYEALKIMRRAKQKRLPIDSIALPSDIIASCDLSSHFLAFVSLIIKC